jgi:hypothetical protein
LEVGKNYKIIYKDRDYTKIASGELLSEDGQLLQIKDKIEGKIWIGKLAIIKIKELGDTHDIQSTRRNKKD